MDAVKFLKESKRICLTHARCKDCPLNTAAGSVCSIRTCNDDDLSKAVEIVENWSEENPKELGKKYIIEIDKVEGSSCRVKGAKWWVYRAELEKLEEYKGE